MWLGARLPGDAHAIKYTFKGLSQEKDKIAVDAFYLLLANFLWKTISHLF